MYEIFKNILNGKDYELVDILNKIDEYYIESKLTKEQKEELEEEARKNANPVNSYADVQTQINDLASRISALEAKVNNQEEVEEPTEPGSKYNKEDFKPFATVHGAYDCYNEAIYYLSKSIEFIGKADVIYFMKGWEKARGCKIEHEVAAEYGKECRYVKE